MDAERFFVLLSLAFATVWTPGPNNIMLASSAATFGFVRTMPHALGVALGFPVMMFFVAFGLGEIFERNAWFRDALLWLGSALLLYIGWRIATSTATGESAARARPFTFLEAAGFQWINPKAWAMAISTTSLFVTGAAPLLEAAICAGAFTLAGLTSSHGWAGFGSSIRRFLSSDDRLRVFNIVMGLLVAGCVIFLFLD
ncbi:MAG: LysE family translocator [Pseudomonadota bacterium]